ncbi:MAG: 4-(cytidine 5'-diphospho)-2-C-methyl-D-erythritol kinase [Gemmatimonadaceae bacterium]
MAAASVRAQAKINLFLHVAGREASGYHHLETIFCRLTLADVVSVRLTRASRSLDCTGPELPRRGLGRVAENLAWRAAVAYADLARWPAGFEIDLEKHIPVSAGLGGGSADAGGVLRALNALNPRPMERDHLEQIARALGADVPFLTQHESPLALAAWRGDRWRALPPLAERPCVLAIPSAGVATRDAYAWLDESRGWTDREVPAQAADSGLPDPVTWRDVRHVAHNDFEAVVFARLPLVAAARAYLDGLVGAADPTSFALMSGSGSAVFALCDRPVGALPTAPAGVRTIVTSTADRVESVQPID